MRSSVWIWIRGVVPHSASISLIGGTLQHRADCSYGFPDRKHTTIATNTDLCLRGPCGGAGVCEQMRGTQHLQHAQKGGGGATNAYHTRDELHRVPEGLCQDVVLCCERGQMAPLGID